MVAITTSSGWQAPTPRRHLELVPAAGRTPQHVFARRRLVALVALLACCGCAAIGLSALRGDATAVSTTAGTGATPVVVRDLAAFGAAGADVPVGAVYVVRPGDTVWSIAAALHPGSDVRAAVDHLIDLNGSAVLQAGESLHLR